MLCQLSYCPSAAETSADSPLPGRTKTRVTSHQEVECTELSDQSRTAPHRRRRLDLTPLRAPDRGWQGTPMTSILRANCPTTASAAGQQVVGRRGSTLLVP